MSWWVLGGLAALAFVVAVVMTPVTRLAALRWGFLDHPGSRSSHKKTTPRGGGLAIVLSVAACVAASSGHWGAAAGHGPFLWGALGLALVGLCDDRFGIPIVFRLAVQAAAAVALVLGAGSPTRFPLPPPLDFDLGALAGPLTVLWIVSVINYFNFMDGIDGLAGLQAVVTGLGLALVGWDPLATIVGVAIAGGALGFLVFNWSPAKVFMGDVGSGFLGYTLAGLPLLASEEATSGCMTFVAVSLWLFLADATWTLLRRMLRVQRWWEPHREHLYQRLVVSGLSHRRVALSLGAGSAVLTGLALGAVRGAGPPWLWAVIVTAGIIFAAEVILVRSRERIVESNLV